MKPVKKKTARRRQEIGTLMDPKAGRKFVRDAENALIDLEERAEKDYKYAREIFGFQDDATRKAILKMADKMEGMAGDPVFRFRNVVWDVPLARRKDLQMKLLLYSAVRLFVACATWSIQIANFKLPEDRCAKCLREVKP